MKSCWLAAAILCSSGVSFAAPGALDTTFNGTGTLTTSIGNPMDLANSVAIQPDGKLVVAGYSWNGANNDFALARYNSDGSLDTSFDLDGKVTASTTLSELGFSVAIQRDGKIVVAGANNYDFVLMRFNPNGSLDTTFDVDGMVATPFGAVSQAYALALQPDGKIVVAGKLVVGISSDFALARYNSDGSLDTTFDGDGRVITLAAMNEVGLSIAVQPDGKIVVAGMDNYQFLLMRYNPNGSLDTSFDGDGMLATAFVAPALGGISQGFAVALQPDGKIVAAGYSFNGANYDFALARYNSDGSLDTTFDVDGMVTTPIAFNDALGYSVALQPDGKIVVAGVSSNGIDDDFALVRYNSDGSLDTTFDVDGKVTTAFGALSSEGGKSIAVQPDGKLAVAGYSLNGATQSFAVARYIATDIAWDLAPAAFTFTDQSNVALGSTRTSDVITVAGLDAGVKVPLQISGGSYSLNGGAYTTDLGWVQNGDTIVVRHTASSAFSTATNTTLTVGGLVAANNATVMLGGTVSDVFTSTTGKAIPDPFSFTDITSQALNSTVTSDAITVTGSAVAVEISVIGGEYSIGCTSSFTTASGTILPGETVCVRHTTASSYSTTVDTTLTIGGVSDIFSSTTEVAPTSSAYNGTSSSTASNTKSGGGAFDPLMALGALAAFGLRRRRAKAE